MSLGSLIKVGKFGKLKFRTLAAVFQITSLLVAVKFTYAIL